MDHYNAMQEKLRAEAKAEAERAGISGIPGAPTPGDFLVDHGLDRLTTVGAEATEASRYNLDHLFSYHRPGVLQNIHYDGIRSAAKHFAEIVLKATPPGADQDAAIRKIREAMMTANAAVATRGYGTPY